MESNSSPSRDPDDVRAEYAAITSYVGSIVGHRFSILGFYLAAVGFIAGRGATRADGFLILGITVALWLMEVRNRSLADTLATRGAQIEREYWGYGGDRTYQPFYNRQIKKAKLDPLNEAEVAAPKPPDADRSHIWKIEIPFLVGYTLAFDVLFTSIGAYAIFVAVHG